MASSFEIVILLIFSLVISCLAAPAANSTETTSEVKLSQTTDTPAEINQKDVSDSQEQELVTELPSTMPTTEVLIDPKNLNERFINCEQKIAIERPNFEVYSNGSVIIPYLEAMLAKGDYFVTGNLLVICVGN